MRGAGSMQLLFGEFQPNSSMTSGDGLDERFAQTQKRNVVAAEGSPKDLSTAEDEAFRYRRLCQVVLVEAARVLIEASEACK
jgi:hypothetical protein